MAGNTLALSIAVLSLFAASGCAPTGANAVPAIKVGALFPMTGSLADKGRDSVNGLMLAIEELNAAGGIASLGGARIELVVRDTKGEPETGAREAVELIETDKVVAILGTYQSAVTKLATQEAERLETPFVIGISMADVLMERGFRFVFRIQPRASYYARDQVAFLADLGKEYGYRVRRVALIHENTDFGTAGAMAQKKALSDFGMEMVAEQSYVADGVTDLSSEIGIILAAKPDAILEVTYLDDSVLIRRALAAAGSTVPLLDLAGGTVSPEYGAMLGPLADGTFSSVEFSQFTQQGYALNGRFRARFGADITGDSAYAYQSGYVLADAIERAASIDRLLIRDALAATDMHAGGAVIIPGDSIRFDGKGQNENARLFIAQLQDGRWLPVWPIEYAAAKARLVK